MLFTGNMKFWYRLVTLAFLGLVSVGVYISLTDHVDNSELSVHHQIMMRSVGGIYDTQFHTQMDEEMCSHTGPRLQHYANISTLDLFHETQFNVESNGEWEMPVLAHEHHRATRPPRLKVVLVPHSHNDPGWLKTVNEYYSDHTRHILNNMVAKLTQYPNMTFIWTETVFFSMWWNELEDDVKIHVKRLIRRGQLEITLGGWVMPDEASSHYVAVIDQLIEGHQWLWENLGVRPENSWSIDPFGYSSTMPYLWQKSGMSHMVIQRVHQAVKTSMVKQKVLEFYWRQMWDRVGTTDIFCHVMPFMLYNIKYTCGPNQFVCLHFDFRKIPGDLSESEGMEITAENLEQSAEMLYQQYRAKAHYFRYNTILVPVGDDFRYDQEKEWDQQYQNYEKLIQFMNSRPDWNVNVQWGTLKDYFRHLEKEHAGQMLVSRTEEFPAVSGDFFPYSDKDMAYWTGYYSTRPFDKAFGRDLQSSLQAADILNTLHYAFYKRWDLNPDPTFSVYSSLLQQARRSLGLFLHHDAITGTSRSFVAEDYEQYLFKAFAQTQEVMKSTIQSLLSGGKVEAPTVFQSEIVRKSHTSLQEKQVISVVDSGTTVAFFNPLAQQRQQIVHLLVNTPMLDVVCSGCQRVVLCQLSPVWGRDKENATVMTDIFELTFLVEIEPWAIQTFILYKRKFLTETLYTSKITIINTAHLEVPDSLHFHLNKPQPTRKHAIIIHNNIIQLTFDPITGSLLRVMDLRTKRVTELNVNFQIYKSQGSGAYIFFPKGPPTDLITNIPIIKIIEGPLVSTIIVTFEPYLTHKVTLYHYPLHLAAAIFVEIEFNIQTLKDKELIMKMKTNIKNSDLSFFTDQNGFQFILRRTNPNLHTEGNYYPFTSAVILEDRESRLSLLAAQPHGVACLEMGQLEVMLDRQLIHDDNRGMGEGVTDNKPTISKFVIMLENRSSPTRSPSSSQYTSLSLSSLMVSDLLQQPLISYFTTVTTDVFFKSVSPLSGSLPCGHAIVNFRSLVNGNLNYNGTSLILHRRGYDCSFTSTHSGCPISSSSITFDNLFQNFSISKIQETTLTHTAVKRTLRKSRRISIAPMEIAAFHFHL